MSMYKTAYYILFKVAIEAILKIEKLEIKEAIEILENGLNEANKLIIESSEEI